tara:strand:- start:2686 stop:3966 length:1281 start_codon:yes stop_codon:yes gene_type:complete
MVFGWGKKKPQQNEVNLPPQEKQITLSKVPDIIKEIRSVRIRTIIAEVNAFRNKIIPNRETILKIATELEHDTLNVDDMDPHLKRLVLRGKNEVISIVKRECVVNLPEINSIDNVQAFSTVISKTLKKIGDALGRHSHVIHIFAKKYAKKLKSDLETMTDGNSEISELIKNHQELESKIKEIFEKITKYDEAQKSFVTIKHGQKQAKKILQEFNHAIEQDIANIKNLKNSNEYMEFLKNKEKISTLDMERTKIKNEIELEFTKISRPLNKYVYVSSLDKQQKKILVNLTENTYDVLSNTSKQDIIHILESVRNAVQSGSVSVKDISKSVSQINEILSKLDDFIEKISIYTNSKNNIEKKLSIFNSKQLEQKESDLIKHQNFKSDSESKIKSLEEEFTMTTKLIPKLMNDIESALNQISAVRYRINA